MGHGLGGQLIAKALGQTVMLSAVAELGWRACRRQPGAAADDWLGDIEDPFIMFNW
ncbi:hypothetical protein N9R09_01780 [Porticoccaceae bacterium]|nr:hypothetical protein [Porticoccaceae bacterium]